jgi:hypothetical protein
LLAGENGKSISNVPAEVIACTAALSATPVQLEFGDCTKVVATSPGKPLLIFRRGATKCVVFELAGGALTPAVFDDRICHLVGQRHILPQKAGEGTRQVLLNLHSFQTIVAALEAIHVTLDDRLTG